MTHMLLKHHREIRKIPFRDSEAAALGWVEVAHHPRRAHRRQSFDSSVGALLPIQLCSRRVANEADPVMWSRLQR